MKLTKICEQTEKAGVDNKRDEYCVGKQKLSGRRVTILLHLVETQAQSWNDVIFMYLMQRQ